MQKYSADQIRNVVLLSHSGAGKTSLSEAMLFIAGAIPRLGRVDDGSSTSDYDPDEIKRRISINLSLLHCEWNRHKVNILDAPGYTDFVAGVKAGMRVAEGAVIVVCAASGVEVGTELTWQYAEESSLPRLIFINKMDRENADFHKVVDQIRNRFGSRCVPISLPIGAHGAHEGVVDLVNMEAYIGATGQKAQIPSSMEEEANSFRDKLAEAVAETDDDLTVKYLEGEEITSEDIVRVLREGVKTGKIVPILTGSALQSVGIGYLLDSICQYLPSPKEGPVPAEESAPLSALVFMTSADPYVGKLTHFRVYSGAMESNSQVWNANKEQVERIGQLFVFQGKTQEAVSTVGAGDIGAVAKLAVTGTGDTLCTRENPVQLEPIKFPEPLLSVSIHPKTKADVDKLGTTLPRLTEEDPTLRVRKDPDTGETILSGMGDSHLEVVVDRMQRKFGLAVTAETPRIPYKETVTTTTNAEYKHKKQTGGHGQYGHVLLELEPLPRGSGFEFAERVVGGAVPKNYIPAVEKGVLEARQEGVLAGYPVVDVKATLYDGSAHPVDSSEISFKIAASQALKKGLAQAQPVLLEPIMHLEVVVPEEFIGDVIGDLNTKRARVLGMNPQDGSQVIEAQVPQAEVMRYAIDLRSLTQGRGTYKLEFSHYEEVPPHIAEKIINERAAQKS
ncbi:MAG: elongation factor G [Chloroflexi bacterium]|nr:MAG: elongation factor G [Chloroflexota bacterium]RLC96231.1 MAG: elongation factor G [Chloroflexota bacterium]